MTSSLSSSEYKLVRTGKANSKLPKWLQVLMLIEQQFEEGVYEPDQPFPTLGELSNTYGVSDITARRVFRELKSQGRIITQGRRGTFIAPSLQKQVVYMCLPQAQLTLVAGATSQETSFFSSFFDYYHRQHLDQRFEVKLISMEFCLRNPAAVADSPLLVTMEAILDVQGNKAEVDQERLAYLQQHGRAIAFRSLMGMVRGVDQVGINLSKSMEQMVAHLAGLGHRHIGMICGNLSNLWFKPRFEGFLNGLSKAGLTCDPRLVEITTGRNQQEDFDALERILSQIPRPTAIVCANDSRAVHALEYCQANHIAVPEELAITGYDNSIEGALFTPALTTMDVGIANIANAMFEMVEQQSTATAGQHQQVNIMPQLVARGSTLGASAEVQEQSSASISKH